MQPDFQGDIKAAGGMGNTVLYRMVGDYPGHTCRDIVRDKMWLIGRAYSAAITRGAGVKGAEIQESQGDLLPFLAQRIVEVGNNLDEHIADCRKLDRVSFANVLKVVEAHGFLDNILVKSIKEWRGEPHASPDQRAVSSRASFVSKYLHFHAPMAFFILDKIAEGKLRTLRKSHIRVKWPNSFQGKHKTRYGRHCILMLDYIEENYRNDFWTPRLIDGHLLGYIQEPTAPEKIAARIANLVNLSS